jgi:hypothetical protein
MQHEEIIINCIDFRSFYRTTGRSTVRKQDRSYYFRTTVSSVLVVFVDCANSFLHIRNLSTTEIRREPGLNAAR